VTARSHTPAVASAILPWPVARRAWNEPVRGLERVEKTAISGLAALRCVLMRSLDSPSAKITTM